MIEIRPIQLETIEDVKELILTVCQEVFEVDRATILHYDDFADLDNIQEHYLTNRSIFLVLLNRQKVIGSGAIRYLQDDICELKRMWILKSYRGQGWGKKISKNLLDFAQGYFILTSQRINSLSYTLSPFKRT